LLAFCAALGAQVKLPPYTREVLPNGVVVYLVPHRGVPLVSFRVLVKGGEESEPPQMAGLADITAELLRRGTGQRTAAEIAEEVDGLGGVLAAGADRQASVVNGEFLKKDFDRGLTLVADTVLRPGFPAAEVTKTVTRQVDGLKALRDNPFAINSYFRSFFFGAGHPYGRVQDEASLDRIRRDDILDYHKRMYVGRNLVVIVAGDFDSAAAKSQVAERFGAAPAGSAYQPVEDRPPARNPAPRVLLIDKPDATQTYFIIAQPGVRRTTPDRVPLLLVNTLFGGRFTSMVNEALRINSGLTYGANCRLEQDRLTGALYINTYTRTESTTQAIDMALDVLKRLREKGLTAEQLASAKAYVKGTYPPSHLQTADQIATALGEMELFGLGRDEVDEFFTRVDGVTLERANAVIRQYYRGDNLSFVLLGNAAKIREAAAKYGTVVERNIRQPGWAPPPATAQ
jgi:predicted Zn-dependent peptidase